MRFLLHRVVKPLGTRGSGEGEVSMSWLGTFYATSIGKKIVVALTGLVMVAYLIAHMLGNLQVFAQKLSSCLFRPVNILSFSISYHDDPIRTSFQSKRQSGLSQCSRLFVPASNIEQGVSEDESSRSDADCHTLSFN